MSASNGAGSLAPLVEPQLAGLRVIAPWLVLDVKGALANKASATTGLEVVFGP